MASASKLTRSSSIVTVPTLAIVGRPNVGKSTLFNRMVGSRRAIVGDEPGITRDRLYGEAEWRGRRLRVVDTGGIIPEEKDLIPAEIFRQARVALEEAAAVILVVDGRSELAAPDLELARLLLRTGKPLFLAVNKIDTDKQQALADEFYRLGIRQLFPVSAEHGRGVDELLDAILEALPPKPETTTEDTAGTEEPQATTEDTEGTEKAVTGEVKVAIIGHPNVGKSTLLNQLTGTTRAIVSPIPGTTRDAVDEIVEREGRRFRFIDTAGIRRKGKTQLMAEKLSVVMARKHLEAADIALLIIDATEGVSALDATIAGYAHESGRSVVIIVNKWDLVISGKKRPVSQSKAARIQESKRPADRAGYEQRLRYALKFLAYAPVLFVSAATGAGTEKIWPTLEQVAAERRKRIPTAAMNHFLRQVDFERAGVPARQQVKIYYMTQAAVAPPTFILFTNRPVKLHFSYQRFLENQIRRAFGFLGTPIWIKNRARD
ncbi:MAG TPA: ribosome biogenesis GTPase Der [Terriglobales bacterium]|jgi:GTP-binding protein|nr:ribosome biogenesis GTPase Der [Terriglobales bacterium]